MGRMVVTPGTILGLASPRDGTMFLKRSDMSVQGASKVWVLIDERMDSINDGFFRDMDAWLSGPEENHNGRLSGQLS